jgi:protoporphyrinogen oxidase
MKKTNLVIIGAGPAGLTTAFRLAEYGITGTIVERDSVVGGISRTVEKDGFRFDIGGHRFFTKSADVEEYWQKMLPDGEMLTRPRLSRIFFDGKFYDYPLKVSNAIANMGVLNALACFASYAQARLLPCNKPESFEEWVTNQFGSRLYRMFFKTYTEKVWGIPCSEIGADWAAQRIKGLSLAEVAKNAIFGQRKGRVIKTLIDEFKYPRLGPGQLWESAAEKVTERGWKILMNTRVTGITLQDGKVSSVQATGTDGAIDLPCDQLVSSMPVRELVSAIGSGVPSEVAGAASSLTYRDFITVALTINEADLFPDNWIYVHSSEVRLGRIQNFKNWSPYLVPDQSSSCLGLEYFVNEGDDLWESKDDDLVELGYQELANIGIGNGSSKAGYVVRMPKAYPVYTGDYARQLDILKLYLTSVEGLHCVGRNGQHRYNNMDHSMVTALIAADNIALGQNRDPWSVNEDAEYHETVSTDQTNR